MTGAVSTGALVIRDAAEGLQRRGVAVHVSGLGARRSKAWDAGVLLDQVRDEGRVLAHSREAIAAVRTHLHHRRVVVPAAGREPGADRVSDR